MAAENEYKVVKGDTLSEIAVKYYKTYNYSSWKNYMNHLADINNIKNVNLIYVGQVLKLAGSKTTTSKNTSKKEVKIQHFGLQSNTDNVIFAIWTWDQANTDHYEVEWKYRTDNGVWFVGNKSTVTDKQSTYSMPSNAVRVSVSIKPVSKTHTVNGEQTTYWTAQWCSPKYFNKSELPLSVPTKPTLSFQHSTNNFDDWTDRLIAKTTYTWKESTNYVCFELVNIETGTKQTSRVRVPMGSNIYNADEAVAYFYDFSKGSKYQVHCRAEIYDKNKNKVNNKSDWSDYSEAASTIGEAPKGFIECYSMANEDDSKADVFLKWSRSAAANSYNIEYSTNVQYFDSSNGTTTVNVENPTHDADGTTSWRIIGLDIGKEYFFRVRSVNAAGETGWSEISSLIIGTKPTMPTTWSLTNTATVGEKMILYWQHNSEDGSKQTSAELTLTWYVRPFKKYVVVYYNDATADEVYTITDTELNPYTLIKDAELIENANVWNESTSEVVIMDNIYTYTTENGYTAFYYLSSELSSYPVPQSEKVISISGDTSSYEVNTTAYDDGANIGWKVRTAGVLKENGEYVYSDLSTERTFNIYSQPYVEMNVTDQNEDSIDEVESFPFRIYALSRPVNQVPIMYQVSITSNDTYETADSVGNVKMVYPGDQVYGKHFNPSESSPHELLLELSAGDVALENGVNYTITCTVAMNSGLIGVGQYDFSVEWSEKYYEPNAEISVEDFAYTASIRPYCEYFPYYEVLHNRVADTYENTKEEIPIIEDATVVANKYTDTGEEVNEYSVEGIKAYFCISNKPKLVEDVVLSVYRCNFDGEFVEIATNLDNHGGVIVTDPHPALDYARYRIVATDKNTGTVSYYDMPHYPVGGKAIIIQWEETWSEFATTSEDELVESPWTGSMLKLPYNIKVSDSYNKDVSLINYIGRKHPVAYYGTQVGETASWSTVIPAYDTETLNGLRRLAVYQGNVYVREPSGSGYWADVKVSFNQSHDDLTIPISLSITRVEGGV